LPENTVSVISKLWTEFLMLLSDTLNTAGITKLVDCYELEDAKQYCTSWPELLGKIEVFTAKVNASIKSDNLSSGCGDPKQLLRLSDSRERAVLAFKCLTDDLKNSKNDAPRSGNLKSVINLLFNLINILLEKVCCILNNDVHDSKTAACKLSRITREEIGLE
jgi:hypothetical protein